VTKFSVFLVSGMSWADYCGSSSSECRDRRSPILVPFSFLVLNRFRGPPGNTSGRPPSTGVDEWVFHVADLSGEVACIPPFDRLSSLVLWRPCGVPVILGFLGVLFFLRRIAFIHHSSAVALRPLCLNQRPALHFALFPLPYLSFSFGFPRVTPVRD